jgi:hypothetical protein
MDSSDAGAGAARPGYAASRPPAAAPAATALVAPVSHSLVRHASNYSDVSFMSDVADDFAVTRRQQQQAPCGGRHGQATAAGGTRSNRSSQGSLSSFNSSMLMLDEGVEVGAGGGQAGRRGAGGDPDMLAEISQLSSAAGSSGAGSIEDTYHNW